jgi:hypothetical protein
MKQNKPILTAVMSKLISERDDVLAQLDLVLNKNISNNGVSGIVEQTSGLFKKLSEIESTIETVEFTIKSNDGQNQFIKQVGELTEAISKLQENTNTENNGNNP